MKRDPNLGLIRSPRDGVSHLLWRSQHGADLEELVHLAAAREEGTKGVELGHDAAHCPEVDGAAVVGGVQEYLRCPVPSCGDVVRERRPRSDLPGQSKISYLY